MNPFKGLHTTALSRGVLAGHPHWLVLAAVLWGARGARYAMRRHRGVVYRSHLKPGETIEIAYQKPPSRRRSR